MSDFVPQESSDDAEGLPTAAMECELHTTPSHVAISTPIETLYVTIVGDNARTIESLRQYLCSAGVDSQAMQRLPECTAGLPLGNVVVIFPDEFETDAVLATAKALQREQPHLRLLLVTSSPQSYQIRHAMDWVQPPVLLPKPAFGWSILDAIRASSPTDVEPL